MILRWIKKQFSREYHVVCNGKTNRPSEKGLYDAASIRRGTKNPPGHLPMFIHGETFFVRNCNS